MGPPARWAQAQQRRRDGLASVVGIHADPTVPDGALAIIGEWPQLPRTWQDIRTAIGRRMFGRGEKPRKDDRPVWSRQALSTNPPIETAYESRRKALAVADARLGKRRKKPVDPFDVILQRRVLELEARVAELGAKLAEYEEYFRRVGINRFRGARTEDAWLAPLAPKIERGQPG